MTPITPATIQQVATLARLTLTEAEKLQYAEELSVIFGYVELLDEVDITDVVETSQVTGLEDIVRDDVAANATTEQIAKLIEAFPEKMGSLLRVKAVFGGTEE